MNRSSYQCFPIDSFTLAKDDNYWLCDMKCQVVTKDLWVIPRNKEFLGILTISYNSHAHLFQRQSNKAWAIPSWTPFLLINTYQKITCHRAPGSNTILTSSPQTINLSCNFQKGEQIFSVYITNAMDLVLPVFVFVFFFFIHCWANALFINISENILFCLLGKNWTPAEIFLKC